jgi:hypothetical protein
VWQSTDTVALLSVGFNRYVPGSFVEARRSNRKEVLDYKETKGRSISWLVVVKDSSQLEMSNVFGPRVSSTCPSPGFVIPNTKVPTRT